MITTKTFSQRDPRWKYIKLGTSNLTIGGYGCAITCLAMLLNSFGYDETPETVNQKLIAYKGYVSGNLLNWTVVPRIWPKVKFIYRDYNYQNVKVAFYVYAKNIPVIVGVNGRPIGAYRHYVLYVGDRFCLDPWDGRVKPTKSYTAVNDVLYDRS